MASNTPEGKTKDEEHAEAVPVDISATAEESEAQLRAETEDSSTNELEELKAQARDLNVEGADRLTESELREMIHRAQAVQES